MVISARLEAFLDALPHVHDDELVNTPGLGTFKAKHIRRGLEREVLTIHSTGLGLAIVQPSAHGACKDCQGRRGSQPCDHCACTMCIWFRQTDERSSPGISREKWMQLIARLRTFELGAPQSASTTDILGDI